jgi:hypothetical protein
MVNTDQRRRQHCGRIDRTTHLFGRTGTGIRGELPDRIAQALDGRGGR